MTNEFERLTVRVKRLAYLTWLIRWFRKNEAQIAEELTKAVAEGEAWLPRTTQALGQDLVEFVSCVSNAVLWTFYDEYNRTVHRGPHGEPHDGTQAIINATQRYTVRCHPNHASVHVLQAVEDIRVRYIHAHVQSYTYLTCPMPPEELLLVPKTVLDTPEGRVVASADRRTPDEQKEIDQAFQQMGTSEPPVFGPSGRSLNMCCSTASRPTIPKWSAEGGPHEPGGL